MFFRLIFAVLISLFAGVAAADPKNETRALLAAGDVDGLERLFSELHAKARESGNFGVLRSLNAQVFATTLRETEQVLNDWRAAYPSSPYANAALGWMHDNHAWHIRGNGYTKDTPPLAMRAHTEMQLTARQYFRAAYEADPHYLPGSDGILASQYGWLAWNSLPEQLNTIFSQTPDRHILNIALGSLQPVWGGSLPQMMDICNRYADQIEGYSVDYCHAQVIIATQRSGAPRTEAFRVLQDDEARGSFQKLREIAELSVEPVPFTFDEARLLLRSVLHAGVDLREYRWRFGHGIAMRYDQPEFENEVYYDILAFVREEIENDPYNVEYLHVLGGNEHVDAFENKIPQSVRNIYSYWKSRERFRALWPSYWLEASHMMNHRHEAIDIYLSYPLILQAWDLGGDPVEVLITLSQALKTTIGRAQWLKGNIRFEAGNWAPEPEELLEFSQCRLIAATRYIDELCDGFLNFDAPQSCSDENRVSSSDAISLLGGEGEAEALCPLEMTQNPLDADFSPVPLEEVEDWRRANIPGYADLMARRAAAGVDEGL